MEKYYYIELQSENIGDYVFFNGFVQKERCGANKTAFPTFEEVLKKAKEKHIYTIDFKEVFHVVIYVHEFGRMPQIVCDYPLKIFLNL
jgi:molybdopterin synthase catalytic subunit